MNNYVFSFKILFFTVCIIALIISCDNHTKTDHKEHAGHDEHIEDNHDNHDHAKHDTHDAHNEKHASPEPKEEHEAHDEHEGHDHAGHAHAVGEDMKKTVEELFADECEHDIKTHACDECRYEVGVVKVPQNLIDQGLVKVQKVQQRNFDTEVVLTGEVAFNKRKVAHLSPRVAGIVTRILVDLGDKVKNGQALVELESAELAEAQADYLESLASSLLAKKSYDRQFALRKQNVTSEREFLEAEHIYKSADIQTNAAKQKLLRLGFSSQSISRLEQKGLSAANGRLVISTPFMGDVLQLKVARGEQIDPGTETIMLGDTRSLWVWVDLYESQLAAVKKALKKDGLPVNLNVRSYPGETFSGRLDFVGRVMDKHTRTVKARVNINNSSGKLNPGMFAQVKLGLDNSGAKPVIPQTAVLSDEGRDFVFMHHEGDYFVRRQVTKGRNSDGFVELLDGIQTGSTVAVAGTFLLKSDVLRSKMGEGCAH